MTPYERAQEKAYQYELRSMDKLTLYLAYIQLHRDNPALHPDDYLSPEGGYQGWHVLLVNAVLHQDIDTSMPDEFHYPCTLTMSRTLDFLEDFHNDNDEEDDTDMRDAVATLKTFMDELDPKFLLEALNAASSLLAFHSNGEGDDRDEIQDLEDLCKVLEWLSQFVR